MNFSKPGYLKNLLFTIIAGTIAANAQAQVFLEEVIVTAQKKAQNIQDVGVSITAFSGEQMEAMGWDNSLDVAKMTPGLITTPNTGDPSNIALFSIRGVSQLDFAEGQEAPIAQYRDQAYISSPGTSGVPSYDIERVEVLRGPQGTLYGRNATGAWCISSATNRRTVSKAISRRLSRNMASSALPVR
jgi:iron complex outermembrane receptor protein